MRLILSFNPKENYSEKRITKYQIQGFLYSLLQKNEQYKDLHSQKGYKFFNFSNIFPYGDYNPESIKKLIISSPDVNLIRNFYDELKQITFFRLGSCQMELLKVKPAKTKVTENIQTATPIVLSPKPYTNHQYSFKQGDSITQFFNRLKENALAKYNSFTGKDFELDSDLFTGFQLDKEIPTLVQMNQKIILIGSLWKNLKYNLTKDNKKFYRFLIDTGLGEKNSLGFGFINCTQEGNQKC